MARAVAVLLAGAVLVTGALWAVQRRLVYFPDPFAPPPAAVGLGRAEELTFPTADGLTLSAWFVPAQGETAPGPAVLVCNGNGGNRAGRAPLAAALARAGLSVLLFDYRGYGGNPGAPSEAGLLADARAARAALAARPEVDPRRLVLFGESLGSAVAAAVAAEDPPAALVLRSPFPSLAEVGRLHYPFLPVRALLRDRYPVSDRLRGYPGPLLVVAGAADGLIPPELSRRVAEAVPQARFVLVPGAGHNDRALLDGEALLGEVTTFLERARVLPR
jgi:fermentation-respiration switch protein FrsA (DUF1100 family)